MNAWEAIAKIREEGIGETRAKVDRLVELTGIDRAMAEHAVHIMEGGDDVVLEADDDGKEGGS